MRARNIKPGFFKNELLATSDPLNAWVFQGLWCLADRAGRLEDRPRRIHLEINPGRAYEGTEAALAWLAEHSFVVRYAQGAGRYIQISNFLKHQNPHVREPESVIPEHGASTEPKPDEHQTSTGLARLIPDSPSLIPDSPSLKGEARARSPDPLPEGLDQQAWERWLTYRREIRKPIKPASMLAAQQKLAGYGADQAAVVEQTIANGWTGMFALKPDGDRNAAPTRKPSRLEQSQRELERWARERGVDPATI